jgi:tRNA (guanine37-N1)-methyltransferase
VAVALVHHPCLDKHGEIYTTSITNLDVHDIARSSTTYGVAAFYVVTPVSAQRTMAENIVKYWDGAGRKRNPDRTEALATVHIVSSVEDAIAAETNTIGSRPLVVSTSAREQGVVAYGAMKARLERENAIVLFGTGHGLAPSVIDGSDVVLEPIRGRGAFNHLSVRSAAAIVLDRLLS